VTGERLVPAAFAAAAVVTGAHAVERVADALSHPGGRPVLVAIYYLLRTIIVAAFAAFTVRRAEPQRRAREPLALGACAVAIAAVLAFTPPGSGSAPGLMLAGDLVAVLGCLWLLASVLALGRCFGVLPEARGLVTRGPYRAVRHPVYLGEIAACAGLALAAPSLRNGLVLAVFVGAQLVRMGFEERALTHAFPEYAAYAERTPRLIPGMRPSRRPLAGSQGAQARA
jgi:protein-S-isoprenylcysteine O-methyltransferase Ste14